MRAIEVILYKIGELSDASKERAHEAYLNSGHHEYFWSDEWRESLEAFAKEFNIKIKDWSVGQRGEGVSWELYHDTVDGVLALKGKRLLAYLWNNHRDAISQRKYLKHGDNWTNPGPSHRMVKWTKITGGPNKGFCYRSYFSNIQKDNNNCPFTGYCADNSLMYPIWELWNKYDPDTTFDTIIDRCFEEWVKDYKADMEYQDSLEYFIDHAEANDYEFTIDGKRY